MKNVRIGCETILRFQLYPGEIWVQLIKGRKSICFRAIKLLEQPVLEELAQIRHEFIIEEKSVKKMEEKAAAEDIEPFERVVRRLNLVDRGVVLWRAKV